MKLDKDFKPKTTREEFGWHARNLPHLDADGTAQFITFRLFDSMPQIVLEKWRNESLSDIQFRKNIEVYLDAGGRRMFS